LQLHFTDAEAKVKPFSECDLPLQWCIATAVRVPRIAESWILNQSFEIRTALEQGLLGDSFDY
jgi:hypothetical protein